jgi:NADPH-dependent 7-cyano-7-deazaguanine reductase QueF
MTADVDVVECAAAGATLVATGPAVHHCPFRDEIDEGEVTVRWRVISHTIELHSLRAYLDGLDEAVISHEEFTSVLTQELATLGGIELLSVDSSWQTADLAVSVSFDR